MFTWKTYFRGVGSVTLVWLAYRMKSIPFVGSKIAIPFDMIGTSMMFKLLFERALENPDFRNLYDQAVKDGLIKDSSDNLQN
jgi:hypothetical protein